MIKAHVRKTDTNMAFGYFARALSKYLLASKPNE